MTKVKIQNIKTNVEKEIEKNLLSDYISTKEWKVYEKSKFALDHKKDVKKQEILVSEE